MRLAIATHPPGVGAGAPPGDLALRRALEALGHEVSQLAWSDPEVRWGALDAVVLRSTWDYHHRPDAFLAWLARLEAEGVPTVNPAALVRWNLDKRYLRELEARGIAIPETAWLEPGARCEVGELRRARGWGEAVVKPLVSASAHGTAIWWSGEVAGPAMVQALVPEVRTAGEWSLVFLGGDFSHAVVKRPAEGDFRVQRELGGTFASAAPEDALVGFARGVLALAPLPPALARVDLVVTAARGPVLMELEVIEPELFLATDALAGRAAAAVLAAFT